MKLVKYYGWERFFEERILNLRELEQRCLRRGAALKGLNICLVFTVRSSVQELLTDCLSTGLVMWCVQSVLRTAAVATLHVLIIVQDGVTLQHDACVMVPALIVVVPVLQSCIIIFMSRQLHVYLQGPSNPSLCWNAAVKRTCLAASTVSKSVIEVEPYGNCHYVQVPPICAWTIFTGYEFKNARLTSTLAFTTLSLLNVMRFPLIVLPKALRALSGAAFTSALYMHTLRLHTHSLASSVMPVRKWLASYPARSKCGERR